MTYTSASPEWRAIISNNPLWFNAKTQEFWGSEVLWDTLTPVLNGEWLFLSLEDNFDRTQKMYSVRLASTESTEIDTLSFQQTSDKHEALAMLYEHSFELGSRC